MKHKKWHRKQLVKDRCEIDEVTGCWNWRLFKCKLGYGHIKTLGKIHYAHRYSYEAFYKPIPKGMLVCHTCDNPGCVNPKHLWLGTYKDNTQDCITKGRFNAGQSAKAFYDKHGYWALHKDNHAGSRLPRQCKLTIEQVRDIKTSNEPLKTLAERHNTSMANVSMIRRGKRKKLVESMV